MVEEKPRARPVPCVARGFADVGRRSLYGRMYDPAIGRTDYVHRIVWRRCFGPIPLGKDVDHKCNVTLRERPDHFQALTKPDNTRKRHQRAETSPRTTAAPKTIQRFAVALFAGIDRTTVNARTLSLEDLVALLSRFEVLDDKRRGRCWSPTEYAPGHTTRGNTGVATVSALVFDLDRVPPDPKRLEGVCWIGHTTWSHRTLAPRWRVAVPLAEPVSVSQWRDVWLRARAALP